VIVRIFSAILIVCQAAIDAFVDGIETRF